MSSKKKLGACIAFLGFCLLTACGGEKISFTRDTAAMNEAAKSVVKLEVFDADDKRISVGSGFFAGDEKVLITAEHVIKNMSYAIATDDDDNTFRVSDVLLADDGTDLALCRLSEETSAPQLELAANLPDRGEAVACIGSTAGFVNLITLGNVSGNWEAVEQNRILFTAPVSSGNSGGPLLDDSGQVIGVVIGSYERVDGMYIAVSAQAVTELLSQLKN